MGGHPLNALIRVIGATGDDGGHRLIGCDSGVFDFGDAQLYGSVAAAWG